MPYNFYKLTPYTTAFLTGHVTFLTHLKKRKIKSLAICLCGQRGKLEHHYFQCYKTNDSHLVSPQVHSEEWLQNALTRPVLLNKLKQIYNKCKEISNRHP